MSCRICGGVTDVVLDLGSTPPANSLLASPSMVLEEYPLVLEWCDGCGNLQLRDCLSSEDLYRNYLYATPQSTMLTNHYEYLLNYLTSKRYLNDKSFVLEVGSNNGLFLRHIRDSVRRVLGIDPATNICEMANRAGVRTVCDFFSPASAQSILKQEGRPDVIVARHCFAHNRDPHPLIEAAELLLTDTGYLVVENAYALNTIENNEFDQIYHEHMFYYSIRSMIALLRAHSMHVVDVLMSLVHGGSIIFVAKKIHSGDVIDESVNQYLSRERLFMTRHTLARFADQARSIRENLRRLIDDLRTAGKAIYSYGATAKGNTLLNFVGLDRASVRYCVDSTPMKQGKYLPKSRIEVISEEMSDRNPPDYYLLTAWNYKDEIITKVRKKGNFHSKFIVPIPFVHLL